MGCIAMLSDRQIVEQFYGKKGTQSGRKYISESLLRKQKKEDLLNWQFYYGDKAAYTVEMGAENAKMAVCFNRVRPYIHSFAGFAAQNRRKPEYYAIEMDDQQREESTTTANRMLSSLLSTANADQVETQQDKCLGVLGYGVIYPTIDYTENPDGQMLLVECTDDYYWDPHACQPGITDRRWEFIKKKMDVKEALAFFGGSEDDYLSATSSDYEPYTYEYWPEGGVYDKIAYDWVGTHEEGMVHIYQYHWYELDKYWRAKNPIYDRENQESGLSDILIGALERMKQIRVMESDNEENLDFDLFQFNPRAKVLSLTASQRDDVQAIFEQFGLNIEFEEHTKRSFYECVLSGQKVFRKRKSVDQSALPCLVKTADYDRNRKLFIGMVSSLREPAKYANASITKYLLIIAGSAMPGVIYDINMVTNPAKFEAEFAKNKKAIGVNGNPALATQQKQQPVLPSGHESLYPAFIQALGDVVGFAPEALGMGDLTQPSAALEMQRIKQVMTTLAVYFDAITLYQKELARAMLYYMRRIARNNEGRAIPVNNDDGTIEVSELYSDMLSDEYVIDIGEAPDSPTQRNEQGQIMQAYADKIAMTVPQKAAEAYALAARYLPISSSDKAKWRDLLSPQMTPEQAMAAQEVEQQRQQIMQIMQELEVRKKESEIAKTASEIEKNTAETQKTIAESEKVDVETLAATTNPVEEVRIIV